MRFQGWYHRRLVQHYAVRLKIWSGLSYVEQSKVSEAVESSSLCKSPYQILYLCKSMSLICITSASSSFTHCAIHSRGKYGGWIGATWGIARWDLIHILRTMAWLKLACSVIGPLLGGVRASWFVFLRRVLNNYLRRSSPTMYLGDGKWSNKSSKPIYSRHFGLGVSLLTCKSRALYSSF